MLLMQRMCCMHIMNIESSYLLEESLYCLFSCVSTHIHMYAMLHGNYIYSVVSRSVKCDMKKMICTSSKLKIKYDKTGQRKRWYCEYVIISIIMDKFDNKWFNNYVSLELEVMLLLISIIFTISGN